MAPKESSKAKGNRPASAPPQRPQSSGGAAEQDAAAQSDEYNLSGELEARPSGGGYESEEEADRPPHIVEDEALLGLDENQPRRHPDAAQDRTESPTRRSETAATGAMAVAKKLTAAQARFQTEQAQWKPIKLDGSDSLLMRPDFLPYKVGSAPEGFKATPKHETGGLSPELAKVLKPDSPPWVYMAEVGGFDSKELQHMRNASNEYAYSCGAGAEDHYKEWKPFSDAEIVKGVGLLLRQGVAPSPQGDLLFDDPRDCFIFGDYRGALAGHWLRRIKAPVEAV